MEISDIKRVIKEERPEDVSEADGLDNWIDEGATE